MIISRKALSVVEGASKDPTREVMQAINIEADGTVVATDGHVLFRYEKAFGPAKEFPVQDGLAIGSKLKKGESMMIPVAIVNQIMSALKAGKTKTSLPILDHVAVDVDKYRAEGKIPLAITDLASWRIWMANKMEEKFPDWREVWPKRGKKVTIELAIENIERMVRAMKVVGSPHVSITIRKTKDAGLDGPVEFRGTADGGQLSVLIMPMKQSKPEPKVKKPTSESPKEEGSEDTGKEESGIPEEATE